MSEKDIQKKIIALEAQIAQAMDLSQKRIQELEAALWRIERRLRTCTGPIQEMIRRSGNLKANMAWREGVYFAAMQAGTMLGDAARARIDAMLSDLEPLPPISESAMGGIES